MPHANFQYPRTIFSGRKVTRSWEERSTKHCQWWSLRSACNAKEQHTKFAWTNFWITYLPLTTITTCQYQLVFLCWLKITIFWIKVKTIRWLKYKIKRAILKQYQKNLSDQSAWTAHAGISDRVTKEIEIRKVSN